MSTRSVCRAAVLPGTGTAATTFQPRLRAASLPLRVNFTHSELLCFTLRIPAKETERIMKKEHYPRIEIRPDDAVKRTDSYTESCHFLMHQHLNGAGRLFGGILMQWIDETAGIVARRHCNSPLVTACIDNLVFKEGAHLNDFVVLAGRVTYVGNSSVEVRVDTYVENLQGERKRINTAYVVMIAIDKNTERPVRVPRYIPQDMRGRIEWENGEKRQQLRKMRNMEGY
jgi:acyl-CoA hydrolase